jgi:TonB-dependent starch-binding outer membrane protein SusC
MKQFFMLLLLCPYLSIAQQSHKIQGTLLGATGTPVSGATITSYNNKVISGTNGSFEITLHRLPDTLYISHINYQAAQYIVTTVQPVTISLNEAVNQLDETVVIGYGSTTRRYNTGSVARVNAKTISSQPVADPLSALSGRLSGVTVTQTSGLPGSMVKLQVRGRNSIAQGSDPLYIIDGVPFATGNQPVNRLSSVLATEQGTGLSPFSTIAPGDIESIEC